MKLIKNGGVHDHNWQFSDAADFSNQPLGQIVPVDDFIANREQYVNTGVAQAPVGVQIGVDTDLELLLQHLSDIDLIAIEISSFADGRGFSIAYRLRHSLNYSGEIWAVGNLIVDQYAHAVQCGIDAVLVEDQHLARQPIEQWRDALVDTPLPYRYHNDMAQDDVAQTADQPNPRSNRVIDRQVVDGLNARFKDKSTEQLLEFVLNDECFGKTALVSSFGTELSVLLHMITKIAPTTPILFIDTGKMFAETLAYQRQLAEELKLSNVTILKPADTAIAQTDPDGALWQSDVAACCNLRKVEPLQNALSRYDSWISGRKNYQGALRTSLQLFEASGTHIKINPLANWSRGQLDLYISRHRLPVHPLVAQGYTSVGCSPCTTPGCGDEAVRAGRWRGLEKTECGIHFANDANVDMVSGLIAGDRMQAG